LGGTLDYVRVPFSGTQAVGEKNEIKSAPFGQLRDLDIVLEIHAGIHKLHTT
jgi:hypothetical protein